jgi:hypothetical protein
MENSRYELKYCEGCGTLRLRPVVVKSNHCRVCEQLLSRFRFPRIAKPGKWAGILGPDAVAIMNRVPAATGTAAAGAAQ